MATPAVAPPFFRGTNRNRILNSCALTIGDLRQLHALLEAKAREAAERHIATLRPQPGQSQEAFGAHCDACRADLQLSVIITATNGEWIAGQTVETLSENTFPIRVVRIDFDSSFGYRSKFNDQWPNANFQVILDFNRTDISDLAAQPSVINSTARVTGTDPTWVRGFHDQLAEFFAQRARFRDWLHGSRAYDLLLFFIGFPGSFILISRVSQIVKPLAALPPALSTALYVYLVLLALFVFRILFNYWKWVFPKTELLAPHQNVAFRHKAIFTFIGLTVASVLIKAGLRLFGIP